MIAGSILDPVSGDFDLLSALALVIIGGACGAVGVWVLQFGRAILAESFTHALLPGLVIAALIGAGLLLGAIVGVVAAYSLLLLAARAPKTSSPTATSVSVTLLVALGALMVNGGNAEANLDLLFGDLLAASWNDVILAVALALGIAIALTTLGGQFAALVFDARSAPSLGINVGRVSAAALALLAISVAVAASVAGSLLALALVTGPALGASAVTHRLQSCIALATLSGAVSGIAGLFLSYYADWPAGASIALLICLWAAAATSVAGLRARVLPLG
ncbi:MAG: metal ABC transporter permease [Solirubrobacterales bacterium]|nr:metal ABC transporter permease [Solirubrobacterales bacterium]